MGFRIGVMVRIEFKVRVRPTTAVRVRVGV